MKRFLIFLLCLSFLNVPVFAEEDYSSYYFERADYKDAITFLSAVGVLSGEDISLNTDEWTISRGEFIQLALRCIGQDKIAEELQLSGIFSDVDNNDAYGKAILYAAESKLLGNNLELAFKPNEPLDLEIASRMAVCMTGRGIMVNQNKSYIKLAYQEKLFDDVEIYDSDKISRGGAFNLLKNILSVDIVTVSSISSGGTGEITKSKGITILHEYLDMEKREGVVTSDGMTTVFGNEAEPGYIYIDGINYSCAYSSTQQLAGKMTEYFVQEDDGELVIRYIEEKNNDIITLSKDVLSAFNPETASYTAYLNGRESFNINRKAYIAYNFEPHYSPEKMVPSNGNVTLIDHNRDKLYDVVLIEDFTNTIVNTYSSYSETLYDLKESNRDIDLSSYREYDLVDINGNTVIPEEIKKYSIASLYESADSKNARVIICYNTKNGIAQEANTEDGTYVIGNQIYSLSKDARFNKDDLSLGVSYDFYLDVMGEITYITTDYGKMAYLIGSHRYSGMSHKVDVQLLPEDKKELTVYPLAKKVKIITPTEKKTLKRDDLYKDYLVDSQGNTLRQMVLIKLNSDNEINQIITALEIRTYSQLLTAPDYPLYYMSYLINEWPERLGASASQMDWKYTTGGFNRWIILGSGAQMFYVPQPGEDITDEDAVVVKGIDFGTSTSGSLPKDNLSFYTKDKDDVSVRYMVNYATADDTTEISNSWPLVVTDMKMTYNESLDDYTWRMKLQGASGEQVLFTKNESVAQRDNILEKAKIRSDKTRIEIGDVVRVAKDASGYIQTISLLWDAKANIDKEFNDNGDTSPRFGALTIEEQQSWNQGGWTAVPGSIVRKSDNVLEITIDKTETAQTELQRLERVKWGGNNAAYIIDYSERKPVVTKNLDAAELVSGDRILILTMSGQSYILVVYRR